MIDIFLLWIIKYYKFSSKIIIIKYNIIEFKEV
jgi:hypothetical protein